MDTGILEDLGLTPAEIKTYLALLELGNSTAGPLLQKSDVQNSVLHRSLQTLLQKGLISYILKGKRKIYQATDPENFYNFMEDKKRRFEEILPELKKKQQFAGKKENAIIYQGIRGINEVYRQLREEPGKEYLSFGGGKVCEERMGTSWWKNHHLKRIQNKLPSRQVFDLTVRVFGKELIKKSLSQIRYLPANFAQFQETVIVGNLVAITLFTDEPYSILIRDSLVAEGYIKYFKILWENARV